jgi:protein phosphatase
VVDILQKLTRKQKLKKQRDEEKTLPVKSAAEELSAQAEPDIVPSLPVQPQQMVVGCGQSVGKQRDHNEDAIFTLTTNLASENRQIPFGLYMVADGMGGQQHGEVASNTAVRTLASTVLRKLYLPLFGPEAQPPEQSMQEIILDGVQEAHRAILKAAPGGGTTLTAALILGDQMAVAHVGDSRLFIIYPDSTVETITRDHSLVKRLEELGQITPEEAAVHPQRNVLYRALGQGEPFDPDFTLMKVPGGAVLVFSSDGLWGLVPLPRIVEVVQAHCSPEQACAQLVQLANEAGGPDNISVIVVRLPA